MRVMLLVPCPTSPAFWPGQVASHSPTQKSICFCCAAAHGFGGACGAACCEKSECTERRHSVSRVRNRVIVIGPTASDAALLKRLSVIGGVARFLIHLMP